MYAFDILFLRITLRLLFFVVDYFVTVFPQERHKNDAGIPVSSKYSHIRIANMYEITFAEHSVSNLPRPI